MLLGGNKTLNVFNLQLLLSIRIAFVVPLALFSISTSFATGQVKPHQTVIAKTQPAVPQLKHKMLSVFLQKKCVAEWKSMVKLQMNTPHESWPHFLRQCKMQLSTKK